jgi:ferritin-like metal-binding protein YciE
MQDAFSTQIRQLLGAERAFATFVEKMRGEIIDRDLVATLVVEHDITGRRIANLVEILSMLGADGEPLQSLEANELIGHFLSDDATHRELAHAPDWLYALTARKFEQFKIAAYTRLLAPARLQGNADVLRLLEDNLEQDRSMARTLDTVIEETLP